ncbi:cysteine-rich protein 2-binding protein-like [Pecten maximus]|uniref:cysteine-rich protein 2-binding protein-like n=1 Tax=Pecten maximus TaxID=6579 RepID=UPI001458E610|nr:cysteine-rich protein 2-binding protein-like [Pecten maximus]
MAMEEKGICYCGEKNIEADIPTLVCARCRGNFHLECLKSGSPSSLVGDVFFDFTCAKCGEKHEEVVERMKMQWTQVVLLALYNLQLSGKVGKFGYYRWKEHICAFIDKYWLVLFGNHRKKTNLWHGTVAGTLSSGCPHHFVSGAKELGESGWWRLAEIKPPNHKLMTSSSRTGRRRVSHPLPPQDPGTMMKVEGLRNRRGKTSIEAAMELKAKRETLLEAKEIRKAKQSPIQSHAGHLIHVDIKQELGEVSGKFIPLESTLGMLTPTGPVAGQSFQSVFTQNIKQEPIEPSFFSTQRSGSSQSQSSFTFSPGSSQVSNLSMTQSTSLSNISSSGSVSGSFKGDIDEDSQFSHSSSKNDMWLTEHDLKADSSLPNLLMTDDMDNVDSDSDLEIDPGTITPPPGSPSDQIQPDSPTIQDILMSIGSRDDMSLDMDSNIFGNQSEDSLSCQGYKEDISNSSHSNKEVESEESRGVSQQEVMSDTNMDIHSGQLDNTNTGVVKEDEDQSVVDSESEKESESESSSSEGSDSATAVQSESRPKRKRKKAKAVDETKEEETSPPIKVVLMSLYEERQLLKKINNVADGVELAPELKRLRRKLIVRQLKRERGVPIFDIDMEMNRLARTCWGGDWEEQKDLNQHGLAPHRLRPGDVRILDRFQTTVQGRQAWQQQQPSFLNRLVGTEDDQLQCISSPYTARILKPFIRRDYESQPLKMRLLEEIKAYPHRHDKTWKPAPPPSIDYCYVRPQHIPSVNTLCREFFWPGIDLSECLQYPDFSCVVLFRKIVIGFAFMVPDVKYNEAYISFLFTHPEWRRAGIAKFMLYHLIQTCLGKDVNLHVSATNSAMLLYQHYGFKPEEFILDFYDKYYPEDSRECKHAFYLRLRR